MLGGSLKYSPTDFWTATLRAGRTLDESDDYLNKGFNNRFNTQRVNVTWQNDFAVAEGQLLTAGLDYYNDRVDSTTADLITSRDNKAGFVEYQGSFEGFDAVLAARYDDNEQFGSRATGNAALGYRFDNGIRLSASWGNAFKAPTFNELYFPNFGNPTLGPEDSESWEAGIDGQHYGVAWSLHGYRTEIDQMITPVFDPVRCGPPFFFCAQNLGRARILGLEAQASTRLWDFDLAATLSLTDPENLSSGANHGKVLPRRSQAVFRFDVDRAIGPLRLGATVHGEDRRFDDVANARRLGGFVTVDLRVAADVYKGLSVEGRVTNLLNEQYQTSWLYHQDNRNFLVTLRYQPDAL
jgi:vitamin B12 transporter